MLRRPHLDFDKKKAFKSQTPNNKHHLCPPHSPVHTSTKMNVNRFKKAMAANLNKLDQKFDEFKSTASQNLQNFQRSREDWGAEDLNPMGSANNFPVDVPPTLDINGQTYRITKLLDEGGYSFVFTVRDVDSGKEYALKRLLIQEEEMMKVAMNEIKVMEQVNGHPNIINFEGYKKIAKGNNHNELYILMELAEGMTMTVLLFIYDKHRIIA